MVRCCEVRYGVVRCGYGYGYGNFIYKLEQQKHIFQLESSICGVMHCGEKCCHVVRWAVVE